MAGGTGGRNTGSEMRRVCESEDHQLLGSSNRAGEGSELHSQMVSKACANSMSITENIRSAHCVDKALIKHFLAHGASRYCLWTRLTQNKKAHV